MTAENLYFIAYQLVDHRTECEYRYQADCEIFGEESEIAKFRKQQIKDAEKAIELFNALIDQEGRT